MIACALVGPMLGSASSSQASARLIYLLRLVFLADPANRARLLGEGNLDGVGGAIFLLGYYAPDDNNGYQQQGNQRPESVRACSHGKPPGVSFTGYD
jgi:hypothetical protein